MRRACVFHIKTIMIKWSVVFFSDKVEKYIPAKKKKEHALFIVRELVSFQPHSAQTDIVKHLGF